MDELAISSAPRFYDTTDFKYPKRKRRIESSTVHNSMAKIKASCELVEKVLTSCSMKSILHELTFSAYVWAADDLDDTNFR